MSEATVAAGPVAPEPVSKRRRVVKIVSWIVGLVLLLVVLNLLGVEVRDWLKNLWDSMKDISVVYIVLGCIFQCLQTTLTALGWYGILRYAYPGGVTYMPVLAAYATGVALNGFLPANIGTFVTLLMFVAIIPSATFGGAIAAYLVQKIFFTVIGTVVYLYLFLSVPGTFDINLGNISAHPLATIVIVVGGGFLLVIVGRIFWRQVKKLWLQAKAGGVILSEPRRYFTQAFLPSLGSWLCKLAVIAIFLAAFAIPVTVQSVLWIVGSGSLANVASFTPGAVGVTQATNALALSTCCQVANETTIAYSTAQQLIVTAWNVIFGTLLVVLVFGWTGGRTLVGGAYTDAKVRAADMKASRKEKKQSE